VRGGLLIRPHRVAHVRERKVRPQHVREAQHRVFAEGRLIGGRRGGKCCDWLVS
jgi:hypothetical protein